MADFSRWRSDLHYPLRADGRGAVAGFSQGRAGRCDARLRILLQGWRPRPVYQIDATCYRNPEQLPPGAVLIVGSGNSGRQIADELLHSGRRVFLAVSRHSRVPRRYRGQDVIWWYENLGRFDVNIDTFPGRRYAPSIIITGVDGGYDLNPRYLGS